MNKIAISIILGLVASVPSVKAERPLLLTEINPSQLFTKQQIHKQIKNIANKQSSDLSLLQQEYLRLQKINAINIQNVSDKNLVFLEQNKNYHPQIFIKHDEGPLPLAVFDIASAAKHKLNQLYVLRESKRFNSLLTKNWQSYKQAIVQKDDLQTTVIAQAKIRTLDSLKANQSAEIAKLLLANRGYEDSLTTKAIAGSRDAQLISNLLQHNSSTDAHKIMLNQIKQFHQLEQAKILKSVVMGNENLASSALMQYAKLPADVRSGDWLTSLLSDADMGASAAKAIGLTQSQATLEAASALVTSQSSSRTETANGLLALRFANNDFSKTELIRLLEKDYIKFKDMQLEVEKWLD